MKPVRLESTNLVVNMVLDRDFTGSSVWDTVDNILSPLKGSKTYYIVQGDRYRNGFGKDPNSSKAMRCYKKAHAWNSESWLHDMDSKIDSVKSRDPRFCEQIKKIVDRERSIEKVVYYKIGQTLFESGAQREEYFKWFKKSAELGSYDGFCIILAIYLNPEDSLFSPYKAIKIVSEASKKEQFEIPDLDYVEIKRSIREELEKCDCELKEGYEKLVVYCSQKKHRMGKEFIVANLWNDVGVLLLIQAEEEQTKIDKAKACFKRAAINGSPYGAYNRSILYRYGIGVSKSKTKADKWRSEAKNLHLPKKLKRVDE